MNRSFARTALAALAALALACSGAKTKPVSTRTVALLPMANESVDVEAPGKVRKALAAALQNRGFQLVDPATVDSVLKDRFGVTDGGQLRAVSPRRMKGVLPGDIWVFGAVKEFGFKSVAAVSQRKVVIALKALEAASGKTLFEGEETGIPTSAGLDAAGDLLLNIAGKVVKGVKDASKSFVPGQTAKKAADTTDVVADVDLTQETRDAVDKLLEKFPK